MNDFEKMLLGVGGIVILALILSRKKYNDEQPGGVLKKPLAATPSSIDRAIDKLKTGDVKVNHQAAL